MAKSKTVRKIKTLPPYISRESGVLVLNGYTWLELIRGEYGGGRPLPCPVCGREVWVRGRCPDDGAAYPTLPRSLTRRDLRYIIEQLARSV